MQVSDEDRLVLVKSSNNFFLITVVLTTLIAAAVALIAIPELRDFIQQQAYSAASFVGLAPVDHGFGDLYKKFGMAPLPAGLAASSKILPNLEKLAVEPCDKKAIFALGEALLADHDERNAADVYQGFGTVCPDGMGEEYRAAQILLLLGDNEKIIAITSDLIRKSPGIADYYYLRGKARAGAKRYGEALADYTTVVKLSKDLYNLRYEVFVEMANIYLAVGKPCEAAAIILAWVAIAPSSRNTPAAQNIIREYQAHGCQQPGVPADLKALAL
jgi:tetratricopeptide (TPR) repeat protein